MVGAFTREFWWNLCRAVERVAWIEDPKFATNHARLAHRAELIGELERIFGSRPRHEWLEILDAADVPNSPVLELHDAVTTEQVRHNGAIQPLDQGGQMVNVAACPIRASEWQQQPAAPAPRLGENTDEVLHSWLGLRREDIMSLAQSKIVAVAESKN